jgi:acyl-homoserine-lactone acylase
VDVVKARGPLSAALALPLLAALAVPAAGASAAARPVSSRTVSSRAVSSRAVSPDPGRLAPDQVKIVTDAAGIPHITAPNFRSLGYGEARAFAADNFCTLAQDFVTVNGDRSKYFGPDNLAVNYSAGVDPTNLDSDLFWQQVKDSGAYRSQIKARPPVGPLPQVLQVYQGFVAGYNAYLASGELKDPACAGRPWVRPITLEDMWLRGVQIATEASSQQFISYEAQAKPPKPGAASAASRSGPSRSGLRSLRSLVENGSSSNGSNGIGIGSQDTRHSDGMVLANPHFPWYGTERFFAEQLDVPGQYDVEGGTLMGFPLVGIGFNSDLAWTHTVSTSMRFTIVRLKLARRHPTSYIVNGKTIPMRTETVRVAAGKGVVRHTFYLTRFGTVLVVPPASYSWSTTTAYALHDANLGDEMRAANQYFEMGRATSVRGLLRVESKYLAIPTFNTIAADKTGHALYGDVGNTPGVSAGLLHKCLPAGLPTLVYEITGIITLDGSTTHCDWATAKGTPVPGILPASQEPHTIRTDYVENSNDSYWLANPSHPFRAFSPIIGPVDVQQGLRTRLGNLMIAERVAGTDGLGKPKFTIPSLQAMWENDRSLLAELVLKPLVTACRKSPEQKAANGTKVNLKKACGALARYERYENGDLDASGGWLFEFWYNLPFSGTFWKVGFQVKHPLTTPYGLDTANHEVLKNLATAVVDLKAKHIPLTASFGQVQHSTKGRDVIGIHGCATGCFNAIYPGLGNGDPFFPGDYGEVGDGSSLVMTTELTPKGPVSEGIVTYSQATNPASPYYANMTRLYSRKEWVPFAYTARQLAALRGTTTLILTT